MTTYLKATYKNANTPLRFAPTHDSAHKALESESGKWLPANSANPRVRNAVAAVAGCRDFEVVHVPKTKTIYIRREA